MNLPSPHLMPRLAILALAAMAAAGCGDDSPNVDVDAGPDVDAGTCIVDPTLPPSIDLTGNPPSSLCEMNLFAWDGESFDWAAGIVPYEMNTPLFTDYAVKARAIYIPAGEAADFEPSAALDFPVGTVLIKNFYYPADLREPTLDLRLIETRLLIRYASGWDNWPYVWDADGGDARLAPSGDQQDISFIDVDGQTQTSNYLVPQRNQCQQCHEIQDEMDERGITPIGPKARYLNRDYDYGSGPENQLEHLASLGLLNGLPAIGTVEQATDFAPIEENGHDSLDPAELDTAARDYLDINCAHCHNPDHIQGITSQLWLNYDNTDPDTLGICKLPGSAGGGTGGHTYDIVPGNPDESILHFRVESDLPGEMMPLLGRSLVHSRGVDLIYDWIAAMPADDCSGSNP